MRRSPAAIEEPAFEKYALGVKSECGCISLFALLSPCKAEHEQLLAVAVRAAIQTKREVIA